MDIQTYGGKCPKCENCMLQKGVVLGTAFQYDACPWCGFAYGESINGDSYTKDMVWESVFGHHEAFTRKGVINKLKLSEKVVKENSAFYPSVFVYDDKSLSFIDELNAPKVI